MTLAAVTLIQYLVALFIAVVAHVLSRLVGNISTPSSQKSYELPAPVSSTSNLKRPDEGVKVVQALPL